MISRAHGNPDLANTYKHSVTANRFHEALYNGIYIIHIYITCLAGNTMIYQTNKIGNFVFA